MKTLHRHKPAREMTCEMDVVWRVTGFLVSEGYRIRHEVPNMGQSADIAATRGRWLTLVEAKVRDWRRALSQCVAHEQVADFICIAIAVETASRDLADEVAQRGYGLILCPLSNGHCEWVVRPVQNPNIWPPQRKRLVSLMRKIGYVH